MTEERDKMTKTIRRDKIRRDIEKGLMEARCKYRYTDNYIWDSASNFGKTDWMPARIQKNSDDFIPGMMNFRDDPDGFSDFRTKSGAAWWKDDGTITLLVLPGTSFALRYKKI